MMLASTYKPKPCEFCKALFTPQRMGAKVCSPLCAHKLVRKARVEERVELKQRKEALKTIPQLIKAAQLVFNRWVRARDEKQPCISCGAPPPPPTYQGGRDAGHFRSTGAASHLRFHEDNCHAQCVHCNQHLSGKVVAYRAGLVERIGVDRLEALESMNDACKWTRDELIAIRKTYQDKLKALKREGGNEC